MFFSISFLLLILIPFAACTGVKKDIKQESGKNVEKSVSENKTTNKTAELEEKAQGGYKLFFEGKYNEAVAAEDAVLKEDPYFYKAYYIKGITQCYAGNYAEGSKNIDKALALSPDDYMARFNKALSLELYGYYDEALVWYDKSLEICKGEWSYYGIASIYGRRGDIENTIKYLKLAIEINPEIKKEAANEADFDSIKNSTEFKNLVNN